MSAEAPYLNLIYFFELIYQFFARIGSFVLNTPVLFSWVTLRAISFAISLVFFIWLAVIIVRLLILRKKDKTDFLARFEVAENPETEKDSEWQDILDHMASDNESQWKLAIIDADKLLEDALRDADYDGETIGDRLKMAESMGGFTSLQDAWEAHKVRNRIAHESGFILTNREARRAVELYKNVLNNLHFFD
jgi:hypothetical protein